MFKFLLRLQKYCFFLIYANLFAKLHKKTAPRRCKRRLMVTTKMLLYFLPKDRIYLIIVEDIQAIIFQHFDDTLAILILRRSN